MKRLSPPSPFYSAPLLEKQAYFLYWATEQLQSLPHQRSIWEETPTHPQLLIYFNFLYKEALSFSLFEKYSFSDFVLLLSTPLKRNKKKYKNHSWFDLHKIDFREKMSFRQKGLEKKHLSSSQFQKTEWRKEKGFTKDFFKSFKKNKKRENRKKTLLYKTKT